MDGRQFSYGFTTQAVTIGAGFTAAGFVPVLANQIQVTFQVPRNDFFLVPVPPSGTLTLAELTAMAGASLCYPLVTMPLYEFQGAQKFAVATTGATAAITFLKGMSANTATFAIG
jgi:hypothetical protein